ncbi:MAG: AAA family ATPase [Bacteroidales bacterium]|jgi:predicted AAA+ superfamily ATPase|nr:AAA family ATPase [Bacteroidales bacterium]MDD2264991.1 AAA family ATPase [Bacteroidales bacterium]MDD2831115.1 AAA family ATPase [Bacteroidales bacterium]MDD3209432.1 AAA family ATPase [Bacteroidales bacterium]MDD3697647.1 AAA family ATPase [Bacteroidales bacterium]
MFTRILKLQEAATESIFLWGARQTGKSTLLNMLFPGNIYIDLLKSDIYAKYQRKPSLLREELTMLEDGSGPIIIDEIQKIPALMDEIHWLITNKNLRFIMSGSSARKLRRSGANLLGGRALSAVLYPFVSAEVPGFDLLRACNNGMIPRHYLVENPQKRIQAYVGDYLQEEIKEEALVRNLRVFTRFLEVAAFCSGEILNYSKIATDCGVSSVTIKDYFSILKETLIGYIVPSYTKHEKRRMVQSPKFYLFDVGLYNHLRHKNNLVPKTADFGKSFEHLIVQELIAYLGYTGSQEKISYWKTATGLEADAIIGEARIAIEIKATEEISFPDTKGLRAFKETHSRARLIAVSLDRLPRRTGAVEVFPADTFLKLLWEGKII